jgi:glycosyltransferase involved in cell wall biosynthesis
MTDDLHKDIEKAATQLEELKRTARLQMDSGQLAHPRPPGPLVRAVDASWVNPHQPIAWPHWPPGVWPKAVAVLQKATRRLLRWYIDPLIEEQNVFNAAVVKSLEHLSKEIVSLRLQLERGENPFSKSTASGSLQAVPHQPLPPLQRRLRLAMFAPLSPLRTALADNSEGLLLPMAEDADVDLYIAGGYQPDNPVILERFAIYNHHEFPARNYDAVLYVMGDDAGYHDYIYEALQRTPGVVILHDTTLHRFMIGRTLFRGDTDSYLDEMEYAYGVRSLRTAEQVLSGFGEVLVERYPFIERVIDSARGIVVHNDYSLSEVLRRRPHANVARIGSHFFLPPGFPGKPDSEALRAEMGLSDRFVVASFGIFVPDKRLDSCLGAFSRLVEKHPEATYLFVGNYLRYDLPGKIQALGLQDHVIVTDWVDPVRFTELMFIADVGIHLRYPHIGGTPFSPMRMMGLGVPTILSDIEPLAEIPEGCCCKIRPDEWEENTLLACLELMADQPDLRHRLAENGRRFIAEYHDAQKIARQYLAFIEQTVTEEGKA